MSLQSTHIILGDITTADWPEPVVEPLVIAGHIRAQHMHIIGRSGTGKSALLQNLIAQSLSAGEGIAVLDPHGPLAEAALGYVPVSRFNEVVYFDPSDDRPLGLNVLEGDPATAPLRTENLVSAFLAIWGEISIGPASQDLLRNSLRALMATPGSTLLGMLRLIDDKSYRQRIASRIDDPVVGHYWRTTVPSYSDRAWEEIARPLQNKLRRVMSDPRCRNIVGQTRSTFDVMRLMNEGQVLIANLAVGKLGEGVSHLLGALLSATLASTAFLRLGSTPPRPFYLYADEFQLFTNSSYETILSQSRKMGLHLTVAHQYLEQLPPALRAAVLGNAATTVAYRLGAPDAEALSLHLALDERYREAQWKGREQLIALPEHTAFVATLQGGRPVTHLLRPHPPLPELHSRAKRIIANSQAQFGRDRASVEARVQQFYTER